MHHVSHQGQQFGPYSVEQINQHLAQGVLDGSTFVWDQNTNGWMGIGNLPGVILPSQQAQPTPAQNVAQPTSVAPVAPETSAQTVVQEQSGTATPSGEKKKTEGEKKKKPAKDKPNTLKMVLMFGIAGVLAYVSYYCGSSALAEHKKPNTDIVQLIMRSLFAFLAICWALVCVKYPFRKEKKGRKKQ